MPFGELHAGGFLDVSCGKMYQGIFTPIFKVPIKVDIDISLAGIEINDNKYRAAGIIHADIKQVAEILDIKFLLKENIDFGIFFSKHPGDSMYGIFIAIK
jgi:hypothetical protein